jgi:hypothetical protein
MTSWIEHVDRIEQEEERIAMKRVVAATLLAGLFTIGGASTALAASRPATTKATEPPLTGAPAYERCIAAGGTAHFCGDLGGYWYFV